MPPLDFALPSITFSLVVHVIEGYHQRLTSFNADLSTHLKDFLVFNPIELRVQFFPDQSPMIQDTG